MHVGPMADEIVKSGKATGAELAALMPFRKFLGERIVKEETKPAHDSESYGCHTIVARSISNTATHPGKTFYGCSYELERLDKDGTPL
jgi:hypothetical protein